MIDTTCKITRYDGPSSSLQDDGKEETTVWVHSCSQDRMVRLQVYGKEVMVLGRDLQLAVENCLRRSVPPLHPGLLGGLGGQQPIFEQQRSRVQSLKASEDD